MLVPTGFHLRTAGRRAGPAPFRISPDLGAPSPNRELLAAAPHLRWHPLRGEWVAYAAYLRYFNVAGADREARMGQRTLKRPTSSRSAARPPSACAATSTFFGTDYPTHDGTCIRDNIHVEDLAAAHLAAQRYLEKGGSSDIINIGYGRGSTVREVIEVVKQVSAVDFPVKEAPRRPGDPAVLVAKAERARTVLQWHPQLDNLEKIVRDAWRWEQKLNMR